MYQVSNKVPLELLGPLGCGIQTGAGSIINSLGVTPGKTVVISGAGAVGMVALPAAKACSAAKIVMVDINQEGLDFSLELGATDIINSNNTNVIEVLKEISPAGFDFGFDTIGRGDVINNTLASLKSFGSIGIVGGASKPLEMDMNSFLSRGIKLIGIIEGDNVPAKFIPQMVETYLNGQFPFNKLIKTYKFEDVNQAIADYESGKTIKPVTLIGEYRG